MDKNCFITLCKFTLFFLMDKKKRYYFFILLFFYQKPLPLSPQIFK